MICVLSALTIITAWQVSVGVGTTKGLIGYFAEGCPEGWTRYTNLAGRVAVGVGYYNGTAEDGRSEI